MLPLGALLPGQLLSGLHAANTAPAADPITSSGDRKPTLDPAALDELYKKAIVVDGLIIVRGWNQDSFAALDNTGYTGFNASLDSGDMTKSISVLERWQKIVSENASRMILATSADDFLNAKKEGKAAIMLGFQNSAMIGTSLDNLNSLHQAGTRWMQLTYNERNLLGDGCTERTNAGLSDFGIEAVERMNELGIIVDLSHCGEQTTTDGIKFSRAPASINHSMCKALYNHPRGKTDGQIRAMADKGGVIGIICLGYMIGPNLGSQTTLETYVDHIEHAVKVGGIDHVGLSSDFAIQGLKATGSTRENWYVPRLTAFKESYKVQWPPWIPELDTTDRYRDVARSLNKRGFSSGAIEKILGQNWIRYFRETLKA